MPRITLDKMKFGVLGDLILQLRFGAPETLLEQSYRAERLIRLIDPEKLYPYDFICYKLTDYKPKEIPNSHLILGIDLVTDLATFCTQVTRQSPVLPNMLPEQGLMVDQLIEENEFPLQAMNRWNELGLVQRSIIVPGSIKQVVLQGTWQWFVEKNERLVAKAAAICQLTCDQRRRIVQQAKELYQSGELSREDVEQILAEKHLRATETIHFILDAYDKDAELDDRIFPVKVKLTEPVMEQMYDMFSRGVSVEQLSKTFGRSQAGISKAINQVRRQRWQSVSIEYLYSPEFDLPDAMDTIVKPAQAIDLTMEAGGDHRMELLTSVQERTLFRAYNYLKWLLDHTRNIRTGEKTLSLQIIDRLEELQGQINRIKDMLILANRALIVSIAKKHLNGALSLEELLSEGLGPLIKSVEKFDYTKGFKFSTYASWAIIKHFARAVPLAGQQQHQYLADDDLDALGPGVETVDEDQAYRRSMAVVDAMMQLDDRERHILENRFGLDRQGEPMSLAQMGKVLGVTKERVRQIEAKAMDKLHGILKETLVEE